MSQCPPITFLDILALTLRRRKTESSRKNMYVRKKGVPLLEEGGPGRRWTASPRAQIIGIKRLSFCIYHKAIQVSQPVTVCFLFLTTNLLSHARLWETKGFWAAHNKQRMEAGAETLPVAYLSTCEKEEEKRFAEVCAEERASVSSAKEIFIIISWACSSECCEFTAGSTLLLLLLLFRCVRNSQVVMYRNDENSLDTVTLRVFKSWELYVSLSKIKSPQFQKVPQCSHCTQSMSCSNLFAPSPPTPLLTRLFPIHSQYFSPSPHHRISLTLF